MIIAERPEYIKNNPRDICHQRKKRGRKKGDVLNILKNEKTGKNGDGSGFHIFILFLLKYPR